MEEGRHLQPFFNGRVGIFFGHVSRFPLSKLLEFIRSHARVGSSGCPPTLSGMLGEMFKGYVSIRQQTTKIFHGSSIAQGIERLRLLDLFWSNSHARDKVPLKTSIFILRAEASKVESGQPGNKKSSLNRIESEKRIYGP